MFSDWVANLTKNPSSRDGIYMAVNYHYIHGYHYDTDAIDVRFDTDSTGMIDTSTIPASSPLVVDRLDRLDQARAIEVPSDHVSMRTHTAE